MKQAFIVLLFFNSCITSIPAQERDTIRNAAPSYSSQPQKKTVFNSPYTGFILPAVFISYGVLTHSQDCLQQVDHKTHQAVSRHFTGKIHADDYTQYVPAVAVYGLDLLGVKAKHNIRDRTFLMASSYILSSASVQTLKRTTTVLRPDESNYLSFPSGHTATAFVGAHLLFKEYKDTSPWIGFAGYIVASGTGAMRILNRRHWVSDVVTGAGIGLLSVEISYLLLPVFHKLTGVKDTRTSLMIAPVIGKNKYGAGLAYSF